MGTSLPRTSLSGYIKCKIGAMLFMWNRLLKLYFTLMTDNLYLLFAERRLA